MKIHIKFMICLAAAALLAAAQGTVSAQTQIGGRILDETGTPLIGASVSVRGTARGVTTAGDGTFRIQASEGEVLSVSFMGYATQEVPVTRQTSYTVTIYPDERTIDEVVVVGYGTQRRSDLTGSVSSVSAGDIEGFVSASVFEALGGQMAGVQITQQDGTPGAGFDVKIRGIGSLTGDAGPLYVVDGFPVDNIDYLANSDIESIDVLKDASASAIYGAQAANGVVLVTTRSGKAGKTTVSYNGSASYRNISKTLDMLSPYEFVKLQLEVNPSKFANTYFRLGVDNDGIPYRMQTIDDYIGVPGVDWQRESFRPTWSQDHNVSISGGTQDTRFVMSYTNYIEDGIFTNSSFTKNTAKVRINQKLTNWARVDANVTYSRSVKKGTGTSADGGRFNMLAQILSARPTAGLAMTDEQLLNEPIDPLELEEEGSSSLAQVNPIVQAQSVTSNRFTDQWIANARFDITLAKDLTLNLSGNYNQSTVVLDQFYRDGSKEAYRAGQRPYGYKQMARNLRWTNSNYMNYKKKICLHSIDAMIGQETSFSDGQFVRAVGENFVTDILGVNNLSLAGTAGVPLSGKSPDEKLLISYFLRGNYSYNDRYLLTVTLRADGSSVFSNGNKWGWFPSFSAAWRVSEEPFMQNLRRVMPNLKLRVGYGEVGNDRIDSYLSLGLYEPIPYGLGQTTLTTFRTKHLPNPNIRWEGSSTTNVGIDVGFLDNRLTLIVDAFVKNTKDLLLDKSLPLVSGFPSQKQNIGKIQNKGLEISLNSVNISTREFTWTTDFNISFIRNTLRSLQSGENYMLSISGFDSDYSYNDYIAMVGRSLGLMYGFEFDGVYQEDDFYINAATGAYQLKPGVVDISSYAGAEISGRLSPGFVKYKDQDGDGVITDADRTVIGNGTPKWYGGITNSMKYKQFDFSFMFQFNYGNDVYNATRMYSTQSKVERRNMRAEIADRWQSDNATNDVPSAAGYIRGDVYSRFIEDGSFLRLKTVSLGYTLPAAWTSKMYVSRARVYVSAQNLFIVTNYSGYDPEVSMRPNDPMMPSFDWAAYPKSRVFTFGVDVQF